MTAADVERQPLVNNPYNENGQYASISQMVFDKLYRSIVMGGSLYFLHTWEVYHTVLRSPKVLHEWFKIGLAASVGELASEQGNCCMPFVYETHIIFFLTRMFVVCVCL